MNLTVRQFYLFLAVCGGSWRNTIFVSARDGCGYLMAADRDGRPVIMAVEQFQQFSGEQIDPAECCGHLTEDGFTSLYAKYLLWMLPSTQVQPLEYLSLQ